MPLFRYKALDGSGKEIRGAIDAESLQEAKIKLVRRQILVIDVFPLEEKKKKALLSRAELLSITRELSRLLEAGLPLYESLSSLEEKYRRAHVHELLLDLCDQIRSGHPFSEALGRHASSFDLLYRAMIANAEKSGGLSMALQELAGLIERELKLKKQLVSALLYPSLLGGFCILVLLVLLYGVVPSLFDLFEGKQLHPFTRFVFASSRFAIKAKWGLCAFAALIASGSFWMLSSDFGKRWVGLLFLRAPGVSDLWEKIALSRFFRATATLLEGGLPAISAMSQAEKMLRHPGIEASIHSALQQIEEGETLQQALLGKLYIPPLVPRMLGIAQTGGNLASMMHQIASIYEEDLEKSFARVTALIQPILLLVLGAMVGFVLLSVLLPLTDVSSFAV